MNEGNASRLSPKRTPDEIMTTALHPPPPPPNTLDSLTPPVLQMTDCYLGSPLSSYDIFQQLFHWNCFQQQGANDIGFFSGYISVYHGSHILWSTFSGSLLGHSIWSSSCVLRVHWVLPRSGGSFQLHASFARTTHDHTVVLLRLCLY